MHKFLIISLLSCLFLSLSAQNLSISGYVQDRQSQERLIGVNLYIEGKTIGTSTNTFGFYSLSLPPGDYKLVASFIGYGSQEFPIKLTKNNINLDIDLVEGNTQLAEVVVTAKEAEVSRVQMSEIQLSVAEIKKIPAFLGEVDIIRAIQLLPGVQSGNEGTTGFYVRGGSPDQNLILLDGVPVYNASHLFGFFSVFNADAIKNVNLTKGGFPARFGGRLSSVLEIDMKEGNLKEFKGEGSLGLIFSKLTIEGPIWKEKTSFILSGRRTYYDILARPFIPDGTEFGYYFADLNAKVNHIFSRKNRLYLSYYTGIDDFGIRQDYNTDGFFSDEEGYDESSLRWGNHTAALRWNHLFNDKLFSNLTATFSQYRFSVGFENYYKNPTEESRSGFEYFSLIRDYGLRYDLEYSINNKHSLKYGASYTFHTFKPGVAQIAQEYAGVKIDSILNLSQVIQANDLFAYIEDDYRLNERWRLNYGLHYSMYFTDDDAFYHSLQPRVAARYLVNDDWSLKGSYALMNQYIHLLSNSGIGLPTDLWVSSTAKVKPQISQQVALGSTHNLAKGKFEFSAETYYKIMDNLIEYKEGASFIGSTDWQNTVETDGRGEAYGLEMLIRKKRGKTTGWVGYTLAWSNRQFSNLNNGELFPYRYDRRHDISVVMNHEFSKRFDIGLTWVFGTGNSFTAPVAKILLPGMSSNPFNSFGGGSYERYSDRNSLKMPAYHRLDLGFNWHYATKWGEASWNISLYNAYNRQNPFFLYLSTNNAGERKVNQVSLFPIIPSVSYQFKF
ncbi:MAG: TonB-dependent receptor [Bacteroidetes bacterium]|nr:MAG: TonB-dependent receptor [Bacteroidota bacterium]